MKGENGTSKRERERNQDSPGCQTFPYHVRNREKPGVFVRFAYFFSPSFSFSTMRRANGHHGSIPTREPLVFPRWRSRKTFQRPRETQTTILRTCISTDYAHNFSRKFLNSTSRNELEDGVIGNDEEIPLIPPFSKINETYPNTIAI